MKNLNRQQTAQSHSQDTRRESSLSIAMRALKRATITSLAALLLFSSTEAAPLQGSLKLNYKVRDTEILYAVATASGDLKVVNKGPGRARVRWIDPATGAEEQKVLRDEEVLFTNGQLGAQVSAGTLVVIEKLGPAVLSRGFATLPSAPSLTAAFSSQQGSGTFLPWHRGSLLNIDGTSITSSADTAILRMGASDPTSALGMFSRGLHNTGAFAPTDAPQVLEFAASLLGTSSVAGGARCSIVNRELSVDTVQSIDLDGDGRITFKLCEDGSTVAVYDESSLEFMVGVPSCPEISASVLGSILAPYIQGRPAGTLLTLRSAWMPHTFAGASLQDTLHCMSLEVAQAP
jgi:hypothetical protein